MLSVIWPKLELLWINSHVVEVWFILRIPVFLLALPGYTWPFAWVICSGAFPFSLAAVSFLLLDPLLCSIFPLLFFLESAAAAPPILNCASAATTTSLTLLFTVWIFSFIFLRPLSLSLMFWLLKKLSRRFYISYTG